MAFISIDKMKQLREQAKNGDERARKILSMQMNNEDFSSLLEEHFRPVQEESSPVENKIRSSNLETTNINAAKIDNPTLQSFLEYNEVKEGDPEYNDMVEAFYEEYPNQRPKENKEPEPEAEAIEEEKNFIDDLIADEVEAIQGYDKAIMEVMNLDDQSEATRKGLIAKLQEIKNDEIEHLEELKRIKSSLVKKEENDIM